MKRTTISVLAFVLGTCIASPLFSAEQTSARDTATLSLKSTTKTTKIQAQQKDSALLTSGPLPPSCPAPSPRHRHDDDRYPQEEHRRRAPEPPRPQYPPVVRRNPYPPYAEKSYPQRRVDRNVNGRICSVDPVTGTMIVIDAYGNTYRVASTSSTHVYREYDRHEQHERSHGYISIGFGDIRMGDYVGVSFSDNGTISVDASIIRIFRN